MLFGANLSTTNDMWNQALWRPGHKPQVAAIPWRTASFPPKVCSECDGPLGTDARSCRACNKKLCSDCHLNGCSECDTIYCEICFTSNLIHDCRGNPNSLDPTRVWYRYNTVFGYYELKQPGEPDWYEVDTNSDAITDAFDNGERWYSDDEHPYSHDD
jgi:hypothetical protein